MHYFMAALKQKIKICNRKKNLHICPLVNQNIYNYSVSTVHLVILTGGLFVHANVMKSNKMLSFLPRFISSSSLLVDLLSCVWTLQTTDLKKYVSILQIFSTSLDPGCVTVNKFSPIHMLCAWQIPTEHL